MERCQNCQYYDRHGGNGAGGKSTNGGQCRRHAPQLSPNSAKNYLIEGVWPTVRDEDWCGEFKAAGQRRSDTQRADALLGAIGTAASAAMASPGSATTTTLPRVGASAATPSSIGIVRSAPGSD